MQRPDYFGRRVLVTGASGFIGAHLVALLQEFGADVHGVSRSRPAETGVRWHVVDLTNRDDVKSVFSTVKPQTVFHLAGETRASRDLSLVPLTFAANLTSSVHTMEAAVEAGSERVVLAGSLEEPDPNEAAAASSPYAASKWAVTVYARMFNALYGLSTVNLRIFMVYGSKQRDLNKLIPHVIRTLLRGEAPVINSADRAVDWVHVRDVVEALVMAGVQTGIDGLQIDVGSGRLVTIREIVDRLTSIIAPDIQPVYRSKEFSRPLEQQRVANVDQSFRALGWRPRVSLDEGLRETVDWLRHLSTAIYQKPDRE